VSFNIKNNEIIRKLIDLVIWQFEISFIRLRSNTLQLAAGSIIGRTLKNANFYKNIKTLLDTLQNICSYNERSICEHAVLL